MHMSSREGENKQLILYNILFPLVYRLKAQMNKGLHGIGKIVIYTMDHKI